jgi:arabinogalactan oligomer/maltooligosaccharide transport system substrate-binding protein
MSARWSHLSPAWKIAISAIALAALLLGGIVGVRALQPAETPAPAATSPSGTPEPDGSAPAASDPASAPTATADAVTVTIWQEGHSRSLAALPGNEPAGVKVEITEYPDLQALGQALQDTAPDKQPDIIVAASSDIAAYAQAGHITPVDLPADLAANTSPAAIEAVTVNSQTWGIPIDVDTALLAWNADLVGTGGPRTIQDMTAYYAANSVASGGKLTAGLCVEFGSWGAHQLITALGGGAWPATPGGQPDLGRTLVNSDPFKANITSLLLRPDGSSNGFLTLDGDTCQGGLAGGTIPFIVTTSTNISGLLGGDGPKLGTGVVPSTTAGITGTPWVGAGAAMLTPAAATRGHQDAATLLLSDWFASAPGQTAMARDSGRPAARTDIDPAVSPAAAAAAKAAAAGVLQVNKPLTDATSGANWYDILDEALTRILDAKAPVSSTLDEAATRVLVNFTNAAKP